MKNRIFFLLLVFFPLFCGSFANYIPHKHIKRKHEKPLEKPTKKSVYEYMVKVGIKYPDVALIQARFESGNFKSGLFRKHSNMFGMRHPKRRTTESVKPTKSGYATYKNWKSSVLDYGLWQSRVLYKCTTKRKYIEYISKVYAESPDYSKIFNSLQ